VLDDWPALTGTSCQPPACRCGDEVHEDSRLRRTGNPCGHPAVVQPLGRRQGLHHTEAGMARRCGEDVTLHQPVSDPAGGVAGRLQRAKLGNVSTQVVARQVYPVEQSSVTSFVSPSSSPVERIEDKDQGH
jgi:hypothetical protein